jgi:filamentous hemagglutinin family protein
VLTGGSATFTGPSTITNILSRVTGGQPSAIDGVLRSEILGANLYLLNPSGVLFGPNASLDVSGSFHGSTADVLRFADGAKFSANLGQESVLTVARPTAFAFLGTTPAAITIQGSPLRVPAGKTLSVVGGDLEIMGNAVLTAHDIPTLEAPSGRLQLASVASPGDVRFSPLELSPDLQVDSFTRLGRLALSQEAFLDTSGNGGGTVLLRGGHVLLENAFMAAANLGNADSPGLGIDVQVRGDVTLNGGALFSGVWGRGNGGGLSVRAPTGTIRVDGGFILTSSQPASRGSVGEIRVEAGTLALAGGGQIGSLARGSGKGGNITVSARESVSISGRDTLSVPSGILSTAAGEPGRISLLAPTVTIDGGAVGAPSLDPGQRAGDISVEAANFSLIGGGLITSSTSTEQHGGDITVKASKSISISGFRRFGEGVIYSGKWDFDRHEGTRQCWQNFHLHAPVDYG